MQDFRDKVAVITGGASGIGLATAQALAREGARLVLADVEDGALQGAVAALRAQGAEALGVVCDVADRRSVFDLAERAWQAFGRVHVVFSNAGIAVGGPTHLASHADWDWSIRVNLWGPIHGVEAFVPRMVEQRDGGHLLFTASFAGLVPNRNLGPYCVTKFGVVALAECLHKDLREHGIGVSVLMPMRVRTRIEHSLRNRLAEYGGASAASVYSDEQRQTMSGRELAVEPVAAMVLAAMRRGDLHIHTHAEARPFVKRRWERIDAAFDRLGE